MIKSDEFIKALKANIQYWEHQDGTLNDLLSGVTFSILVILDGDSLSFDGDIRDLVGGTPLHEKFYENEERV